MIGEKAPEELARLQTAFAAHIRDPENVKPPVGIEDRRMGIYRDLFFNNIRNFLSSNFPVLSSLYNSEDWTRLCRDFYTEFRCHTPLFPEIPREFIKYLQDTRAPRETDPPFMLDLAHYEWVELALSLDESDIDEMVFDPQGDLLKTIPVLSPVAWPLSYQYPVHQIRKDFQPLTAPDNPTHLLVWRSSDFQIKFMQLNQVTLLLLQKMKEEKEKTGKDLLKEVAETINHPNPDKLIAHGETLMNELREKQVILGSR